MDSITGVEAAYVARTRLRRAILTCNRLIARKYCVPEPILPDEFESPPGASEEVRLIVVSCNRLAAQAHILSQPSEPLDDRWRSNWHSAVRELMFLRQLIVKSKLE